MTDCIDGSCPENEAMEELKKIGWIFGADEHGDLRCWCSEDCQKRDGRPDKLASGCLAEMDMLDKGHRGRLYVLMKFMEKARDEGEDRLREMLGEMDEDGVLRYIGMSA
jgi:hypothetical protein